MPPLEHGQLVNFGGTDFQVEVVSPKYTRLVPVSDPLWMLRFLATLAPPKGKKK
ncbi:hypothetical protein [Bradyrhizobium ottawaense]|uniref:hypothetical protein n=1 Tax=Bradyrhizobium ottawaense TaxID=931866 RepID=UPI0012FE194C|nr:hypothetical protein [Bradyrhizobium ottawaense]